MSEEIKETVVSETQDKTTVSEDIPRSIVIEEAIEAILFAAGHPISYATLARVFESTPAKVRDIVAEYSLKYNNSELPRGVLLLTYSDSCQLCTKEHYLTEIRDALGIKKSGTLSSSAMETLAIVAYNQPVTRLFVDTLRKVDSSYAMNSLIDRGLIECKGRLDVPGRPMLYGTTSDFLRCFGLNDLDSLPKTTEEMTQVFTNAKLGEENNESSEENAEMNNGEGTQITIEDVEAAEAATESEINEIEEPSAEDDIIADDILVDYDVAADETETTEDTEEQAVEE